MGQLSRHVADQIYDGRYFDPSTRAAVAAIWQLAEPANGTVKIELFKGNMHFLSLIARTVYISKQIRPWKLRKVLTLSVHRASLRCLPWRRRAWPKLDSSTREARGKSGKVDCK